MGQEGTLPPAKNRFGISPMFHVIQHRSLFVSLSLLFVLFLAPGSQAPGMSLDKTGKLWAPYLEWSLTNSSYSGNAYDLVATVTFSHQGSGASHTTEMFYDGGNTWKFRFAGTKTGTWTFNTSSNDSNLNGHSGTVTINPNPGVLGFVTNVNEQWVRQVSALGVGYSTCERNRESATGWECDHSEWRNQLTDRKVAPVPLQKEKN